MNRRVPFPVRKLQWQANLAEVADDLVDREWLVTNGLGGYAAGSIAGIPTRRFHGWLIAALPSPIGRATMLNRLEETLRLPDGRIAALAAEDRDGGHLALHGENFLAEFRLEAGLPIWKYVVGPYVLEKRVILIHLQNTVHITYTILEGEGEVRIRTRPHLGFRAHEGRVEGPRAPYAVHAVSDRYEVLSDGPLPPLRMHAVGEHVAFTIEHRETRLRYRVEESRGYDHVGTLTSPGYFRATLSQGKSATLIASTESWEIMMAVPPAEAIAAEHVRRSRLLEIADPRTATGLGPELVLAADQFIITPGSRVEDTARAEAAGDAVRTVIAGYHWFTDWGRDTMISLEGLTLLTGRHAEAGYILRTFAHYVRDGLIPNMFPEGKNEGLYHTADASLWFFHALSRYIAVTNDRSTLERIVPVLKQIADAHLRGTHFGIGVDAKDGLLRQGAPGYQLTWMDAKVDDWVVTPRRGKAVEINALFYNALRLLGDWLKELEGEAEAAPYVAAAERVRVSFNQRFWYEKGRHLYDVVDGEQGNDAACRPNQLFAIALGHPVLDEEHWKDVLDVCERALVTPVGLRSLSPDHPDYKSRYFGDLRARDAAYHQGTVWGWLIGPFADAYRKVRPHDHEGLSRVVSGLAAHLDEGCIGSVSEIFDAQPPFTPRGCVAQAWSVAELLRCWVMLSERRQLASDTGPSK